MSSHLTIRTIDGKQHTVAWHGDEFYKWSQDQNIEDAQWVHAPIGKVLVVLLEDGNIVVAATALPAFPRHPTGAEFFLFHAYASLGINVITYEINRKMYSPWPSAVARHGYNLEDKKPWRVAHASHDGIIVDVAIEQTNDK